MSRFVRRFLFASLIACHAAVVLCGPCLHELPGSTHQMGTGSSRIAPTIQSNPEAIQRRLPDLPLRREGQLLIEFSRNRHPYRSPSW